jgi:hypothetical protein
MDTARHQANPDGHGLFEVLVGPRLAKHYTDACVVRTNSFQDVVVVGEGIAT